MTVLFCDLVDSTPLAERLDSEDLLDVIVAYREACSRAIERFGGHLARHVGDGMIVYFGYPTALEDDAVRAAHAGLRMIDEIATLNQDLQRRYGISLAVRIGAHTGEVVAGSIGGVGGDDIVGETPNIAARIESHAERDTVLVSDTTAHSLKRYFELEALGPTDLAGVSRDVSTFRVVRPTGVVGRIDLTGPIDVAPMQGRDSELQQLTALWAQAKNGDGQVALVSAQPGMGKSRMVRAMIAAVGAEASAVQVWQCSPHQQTRAFHPVISYLEGALELDRNEPEQAVTLIEEALTTAGLLSDEACSALAALLNVSTDQHNGAAAAGREARATTLRLLEDLLVANQRPVPLLLIIDDAQWADPSTLELLGRIMGSVQRTPVLILLAARPEFEFPWELDAPFTRLRLQPLSSDSVDAMLLASTASSISPEVRERVVSAADGIPLFVEEMAKMLAAEITSGGAEVKVPASLHGLLMARLDRHADARDLVSLAAVLGGQFSAEVLAAIAPDMPLASWLPRLVADGLFVEDIESDNSQYTFSHALLRDIAYGTLLRRQRRELHRTVAHGVAERLPELGQNEPEMLAFHWSKGGAPALAVPLWHSAGERALKSASFKEAAEHYRRGLDDVRNAHFTITDDAKLPSDNAVHIEAELLTSLGASLQAGSGYATSEVDEIYLAARATARRSGSFPTDSIDRGEFMMELLRAHYVNALEIADAVRSRGEQTGDPTVVVEGHLYSGLVQMYLGDLVKARSHFEIAIDEYVPRSRPNEAHDALGDSGAMAMSYLSPILWILGHPPESTEMRETSLTLAEGMARPMTLAQTWGMHALGQIDRGEQREVAAWAERAYRFAHERDITYWRNLSGLVWGWVQGRAGRLSTGMAEVEAHRQAYVESGSRLGLPLFCIFRADLRELEGDYVGALADVEQALDHVEKTSERYFYSGVLRTQARLLLGGANPDHDAARASLMAAIEFDRKSFARTRELGSLMQCFPLCDGDERTILLNRLQELCGWFAEQGDVPGLRQARAVLAG